MRLAGLNEGPPMGMSSSTGSGPRSMGTPLPLKIRPSMEFPYLTCMGCPRKRTESFVLNPLVPPKTWRVTISPETRMTCPGVCRPGDSMTASSPSPTSLARRVAILPVISVIRVMISLTALAPWQARKPANNGFYPSFKNSSICFSYLPNSSLSHSEEFQFLTRAVNRKKISLASSLSLAVTSFFMI